MHGSVVVGRGARNPYARLEVQQIKADLKYTVVKCMVIQAFDVCNYLQSLGSSRISIRTRRDESRTPTSSYTHAGRVVLQNCCGITQQLRPYNARQHRAGSIYAILKGAVRTATMNNDYIEDRLS
jgi:hypothetical protein